MQFLKQSLSQKASNYSISKGRTSHFKNSSQNSFLKKAMHQQNIKTEKATTTTQTRMVPSYTIKSPLSQKETMRKTTKLFPSLSLLKSSFSIRIAQARAGIGT